MVRGQARNALFGRDPALDRRSAAGYPEEKGPVFRKTGKEWNAWNKSAPTPKRNPKPPPKPSKPPPKLPPKPSKLRPRRKSRASRFSAASAGSFQTPGARSTATAARGASARGRSRCSHC